MTHENRHFISHLFRRAIVYSTAVFIIEFVYPLAGYTSSPIDITIDLTSGPVSTFIPAVALGAGVDGHSHGDSDAIYQPATISAMRSAGLGPLSYRLRTELAIEAWHWNPKGQWSDPEHAQGYWTSSDQVGEPILASYGYRLPRRGNTIDQAEDEGYSRLADGDFATFWKSNPYLDHRYTGEDNNVHPQWLIADLGQRLPINTIRIVWGHPYATRYTVQYWHGTDPQDPDEYPEGHWQTFPNGAITAGDGADRLLRLSHETHPIRFLRVLLQESSGTHPAAANDPRDALGYAVREIQIGMLTPTGKLQDVVRHAKSRDRQTRFFVSSTDPWHRASDLDKQVEQPGIDRILTSPLSRGLPVLLSVGALYDTPENAAALLRYVKRRGYPVRGIEIGEEPDGQYAAPEDYGALYRQTAAALRAVDPATLLGGPSLQSFWDEPMMAWSGTGAFSDQPWVARWVAYLRAHRDLTALGFFSFEWYPFDEVCKPAAPQLRQGPTLLKEGIAELYRQGLPRTMPLYMTEYGYSAFSTQATVDLPGALFNADALATFLMQGGAATYLYGYEPSPIYKAPNCNDWGNNTLFLADDERRILARTATYHGTTLLTQQWLGEASQPHRLYPTRVTGPTAEASTSVTAYAVQRPDNLWSLLLLNKDPQREWRATLHFKMGGTRSVSWSAPADIYQFSAAQYRWQANGEHGRPLRSQPPAHTTLAGSNPASVQLPPWSLTVVRGTQPFAPAP